jgi:hypothetical protein
LFCAARDLRRGDAAGVIAIAGGGGRLSGGNSMKQESKPPRKKANPYARAIAAYYQTLKEYAQQYALHEGAVSTAFQTLLADTGRAHHWTLIPQFCINENSNSGYREHYLIGYFFYDYPPTGAGLQESF